MAKRQRRDSIYASLIGILVKKLDIRVPQWRLERCTERIVRGDQYKIQRSAVISDFAGTCVKDCPIVQHAHGLFASVFANGERNRGYYTSRDFFIM